MNALSPNMPPLPPRLAGLPIDERGFPVPYFTLYINGKPDHRAMDMVKHDICRRNGLCWVCGKTLPRGDKFFLVGPVGAMNGISREPPGHRECMDYAARACPHLRNPRAKRRPINVPEGSDAFILEEKAILRNPGVIMLVETDEYRTKVTPSGGAIFSYTHEDVKSYEVYSGGGVTTDMGLLEESYHATRDEIYKGMCSPAELARYDQEVAVFLVRMSYKWRGRAGGLV